MSLRALKTFVTIAKQGSFAAAAHKLGLTQAAVSLQIKKLEDEFETALFDRNGHRPVLNSQGRSLLEEAEEIINHYERLKGILHKARGFSGPLVIGSINTVQLFPLPSVIKEIQEKHPFLEISIKSGLSARLAHSVDMGQLDFAITTEPQTILPPNLTWTPYCKEDFFVVGPKSFQEDTAKDLLENHPFVCFDRKAWAGQIVEKRLQEDGIITKETMELDSLEATLRMAEASLGVAIVSLSEHRRNHISQTMKVVPFNGKPFYRENGLLYKTNTEWLNVVDLFLQTLQEHSSASH